MKNSPLTIHCTHMSDGKGGGGIKSVSEAVGNVAKAATVDLAKDIFEQIMSGGSGSTDPDEQTGGTPSTQHQQVMYQAQRNARMAQIQRNISRIRKEREAARKEVQQKEQERQQKMQEQVQAAKQTQEEGGFAKKSGGLLKNMANFIARKGKGEQRGAKIAG